MGTTPISDAVRHWGVEALEAEGLERDHSYKWLPWRTGRKVGRTIYAQVTDEPSDDDVLIGVMDTSVLAHEAVMCHNLTLDRVQHPDFAKAVRGSNDE
jgi:hypothetical protein